ncbi:MAG: hypothetical protein HKL80_09090, partial [Acidimicrobiales bacterium]|nr:hypothetical protein [Acidimicrobiales bacterium]
LLHYWMSIFGSSSIATRALPGVIGVLTLPVSYKCGTLVSKVNKAEFGISAMLLVAASPFAIYYSTDVRMYSLLVLFTGIGMILFHSLTKRPSIIKVLGIGVITSLLLYSHYWSLYLIAIIGASLVGGLFYEKYRKISVYGLIGIGIGCLTFIPWLPTFIYQSKHTGTPWAQPASPTAIVQTITQFAGGNSVVGRLVAIFLLLLLLFAIFGAPIDKYRVEIDLKTRSGVRYLVSIVFGTLALAIVGGYVSKSAFSVRYTAVVFLLFICAVAFGLSSLKSRQVRQCFIIGVSLLSLVASSVNIYTDRSESAIVGNTINKMAKPGDIVVYCPDQLGPAVYRVVTANVMQVVFPTFGSPKFVDWVDYQKRNESANIVTFVNRIEAMASNHNVFYVWEEGYLTFGVDCETMAGEFQAWRPSGNVLVEDQPTRYYEHEHLTIYPAQIKSSK